MTAAVAQAMAARTWLDGLDPTHVEAHAQGVSADEIHEGARAGKYRPENPPTDVLLPEVY